MFTDKELDILEFEIFPIVNKFNDLQKIFENLNEDHIDLFSKWCQSEDIDISEIIIGTYWKEEDDVLYLCGFPKKGYKKYKGDDSNRPWAHNIKSVITETRIILPESCEDMFYNCFKLKTINGAENWNTSKVKDMDWMFYWCRSLENLDVSNWDVSTVKNMRWMFNKCGSLKELDVSNWNVSNVEIMYGMFANCKKLEFLNVSDWDVSKVEVMNGMFENCSSLLESKGILNWDLRSLKTTTEMFNNTPNFKDKDKILKKFGVK